MRAVLIALLLFAALPVAAKEPPPVVVNPDWARTPSAEEIGAYYPPDALSRGLEGRAVMECVAAVSGALQDCKVIEETPPGEGFGEALLKVAPRFLMKPATVNGIPVAKEVRIPLTFRIPPPAEPVLVENPDWLRKPSGEDVGRFMPPEALRKGIDGSSTIECRVMPHGALEDCTVIEEDPTGVGFGAAALLAAPLFIMKPGLVNGRPVARRVRIPLKFRAGSGREVVAVPAISKTVWERAPSFEQVAAAWPDKATADFGHVSLNCRLTDEGRLRSCRVTTEAPRGQGFGKAARDKLAPLFKLRTTPQDAVDISRARIELPIHFINPASSTPRAISEPRWITQLNPDMVLALYPPAAADAGIRTGRGVADCEVAANGALTDCRASSADPEGYGFAEAAVSVASVMVMNPWSGGGGPVDGVRIRLPVRFNLAPEEETSAAP